MPLAIVLGILFPGAHSLSFLMPGLIAALMFLSFVGGTPSQEPGSTRWVATRVLAGSAALPWGYGAWASFSIGPPP